jgi:hypothetical protein
MMATTKTPPAAELVSPNAKRQQSPLPPTARLHAAADCRQRKGGQLTASKSALFPPAFLLPTKTYFGRQQKFFSSSDKIDLLILASGGTKI